MVTRTATIRVSHATRDLLAAQALRRGLSVAALLAEIARERETVLVWESERHAVQIDAGSGEVQIEEQAWDAVVSDGVE